MSRSTRCSISAIAVVILSALALLSAQAPTRPRGGDYLRRPAIAGVPRDIASSRELTRKLLAGIAAHHARRSRS